MRIKLKELLAKRNIAASKLCETTGINKNTISNYVNNTAKNINISHIEIICTYLNCNINDLFELDSIQPYDKDDTYLQERNLINQMISDGYFDDIICERLLVILQDKNLI